MSRLQQFPVAEMEHLEMATGGRPVKKLHPEPDCAVQNKRGKKDHVKRKQNLRKNELKNQANQFKHGRGH